MYSSTFGAKTNSKNQNPPKSKPLQVSDFKTKPSLSNSLCEQTFKNTLRNDGKTTHNENRIAFVDPKVRKRREQVSHIFSGEDNEGPRPMYSARYVPSRVMFDDSYVEKNPKINKEKQVRYIVEKKLKEENNHLYSDELRIAPQRKNCIERKIKENFETNPIQVLTPQQNMAMNEEQKAKAAKRSEAYNGYMGSDRVKRSFRTMKKDPYENEKVLKVTDDDFDTMARKIELNKEEPNYGKRHYRVASVGNGVFTYMA